MQETAKQQEDKPYKCKFCEKGFRIVHYARAHEKTVHVAKEFECAVCSKRFRTKRVLESHLPVHKNDKAYRCDLCPNSYKRPGELYKHRAQMHSHNKLEFPCKFCYKVFATKPYLKQHMSVHSNVQTLECKICDTSFKGYSSLRNHRIRVHDVRVVPAEPQRNHKCAICEKAFTTKGNLHTHMLVHTGQKRHTCSVCCVSYKLKGGLTAHKVREKHGQVDERYKFECYTCGKMFSSKFALTRHIPSHERDSRHKCDKCDEAFGALVRLRAHIRLKHNSE